MPSCPEQALQDETPGPPGRQVICTKVRDGDKRIVRLKEGSPRGRHVVIVDDLVQRGGRLVECPRRRVPQARARARAGCGSRSTS